MRQRGERAAGDGPQRLPEPGRSRPDVGEGVARPVPPHRCQPARRRNDGVRRAVDRAGNPTRRRRGRPPYRPAVRQRTDDHDRHPGEQGSQVPGDAGRPHRLRRSRLHVCGAAAGHHPARTRHDGLAVGVAARQFGSGRVCFPGPRRPCRGCRRRRQISGPAPGRSPGPARHRPHRQRARAGGDPADHVSQDPARRRPDPRRRRWLRCRPGRLGTRPPRADHGRGLPRLPPSDPDRPHRRNRRRDRLPPPPVRRHRPQVHRRPRPNLPHARLRCTHPPPRPHHPPHRRRPHQCEQRPRNLRRLEPRQRQPRLDRASVTSRQPPRSSRGTGHHPHRTQLHITATTSTRPRQHTPRPPRPLEPAHPRLPTSPAGA